MFQTLEDAALAYPHLRRYLAQGFALVRPIMTLELEFDIESVNQKLRVNAENSQVRAISRNQFTGEL